jgi:hypothetical protein
MKNAIYFGLMSLCFVASIYSASIAPTVAEQQVFMYVSVASIVGMGICLMLIDNKDEKRTY